MLSSYDYNGDIYWMADSDVNCLSQFEWRPPELDRPILLHGPPNLHPSKTLNKKKLGLKQ